MHITRITRENDCHVIYGKNYYVLPAAIDLDSHFAKYERNNGKITEWDSYNNRYFTFENKHFYKMGKQLAKM